MLKLERCYVFKAAQFTFGIALSCGNVPIRTIDEAVGQRAAGEQGQQEQRDHEELVGTKFSP